MQQVASCEYYMWGSGGKQQSFGALCILSLNMIIDKVYLILWFWFVILIIFGCIRIFQR